jgi:hypothetical protein
MPLRILPPVEFQSSHPHREIRERASMLEAGAFLCAADRAPHALRISVATRPAGAPGNPGERFSIVRRS